MVKLFVEGGGDAVALKSACREGFTTFITKAGIRRRPRIVACGSRADAYDSYRMAIAQGEEAMLLVDSEDPVAALHQQGAPDTWHPWAHLHQRDGWRTPLGSIDTDCHMMAQVMESWLLADRDTLQKFFDQGFAVNSLPAPANPIESIAKSAAYQALQQATSRCKTKASYGKGEHSFKLLRMIDPAKVMAASPWAKRFIEALAKKMGA